jgi:hypothetical protein
MAEQNLTTMNDLGTIKTIDFVNQFSTGIEDLLELLGVTRKERLTSDMKIKTYKWETTLQDGNVGEGEDIPLSKATHEPDNEFQVSWNKYRRAVSVESIARHGASKAIDQADAKIMRKIQHRIKSQFTDFLGLDPTTVTGEGLQKALAATWGQLASFDEFNGSETVAFVNPMDVATYLGDKDVGADASNTFGFTLLKNFLGMDNVVTLNSIPQGEIYSTAVDNLVLAYLDMRTNDVGDYFVDFTDETGYIGAARDRKLGNATYETLFLDANVLFAEIPEGVVKATIETPTTVPEV